jgi:hypothetical protein
MNIKRLADNAKAETARLREAVMRVRSPAVKDTDGPVAETAVPAAAAADTTNGSHTKPVE